jgi:hypothetical protein
VQRDETRVGAYAFDGLARGVVADGTDVTDTLCHDYVGFERVERLGVHIVYSSFVDGLGDVLVYFGARPFSRNARLRHRRLSECVGRVVALVGDTDGFDTDGVQHLRRRWQERDCVHHR